MVDTVGFYIVLEPEIVDYIKKIGILSSRVDKLTGEIEYEFTNLKYQKSFSSKVSLKLNEKTYSRDVQHRKWALSKSVPYLSMELSICKYLLGHNVESVSIDRVCDACCMIRDDIRTAYGFDLPPVHNWYCYRLDTCANFILGSVTEVTNYINYIHRLDYPRRRKMKFLNKSQESLEFENSGLYYPGSYETFKIYSKGLEFKAHDAVRFLDSRQRDKLQVEANPILRIEVENKKSLLELRRKIEGFDRQKKLYSEIKYLKSKCRDHSLTAAEVSKLNDRIMKLQFRHDAVSVRYMRSFNGYMTIVDTLRYLDYYEVMTMKMKKLLNGTESRIMKSADVELKLSEVLGDESGRFYYGFYMMLITQGQKYAKERYKKATFYKGMRVLRECGISFLASDIKKISLGVNRGFPEDFSLELCAENKYYQMPKAA